jgi:tetratricopeptide (TPR) repeat protein
MNVFIGDAYMAKGDKENAIASYQACLAEDENNVSALKRIGDIYVKDYDYANALQYYTKLAELESDNASIVFVAAQVANGAGEYTSAIDLFEQFIVLEPGTSKTAEAHMTLGYLYSQQGNCDKSEEHFNAFNTLMPNSGMEGEFAAEVERCRSK